MGKVSIGVNLEYVRHEDKPLEWGLNKAAELEYGQLVIPLDLKLETRNAFYLVHQKGRQLTYGMQSFYDWVFEQVRGTG